LVKRPHPWLFYSLFSAFLSLLIAMWILACDDAPSRSLFNLKFARGDFYCQIASSRFLRLTWHTGGWETKDQRYHGVRIPYVAAFGHLSGPIITPMSHWDDYWAVFDIYGFIPILLLTLSLMAYFRFKPRRSPSSTTQCQTCGYDLRATPHQCPECGTIPLKPETTPT
jgi:hypothetical protein